MRGLRRAAGLSQVDLARRVGVSRQWLIDLEAGKRTVEAGLVLGALQALGATLDVSGRGGPEAERTGGASPYDDLDIPSPEEVLARTTGPSGGRR